MVALRDRGFGGGGIGARGVVAGVAVVGRVLVGGVVAGGVVSAGVSGLSLCCGELIADSVFSLVSAVSGLSSSRPSTNSLVRRCSSTCRSTWSEARWTSR